MSGKDLVNIQKRALQEGLPYQTLMSSVLHKYITGHSKKRLPKLEETQKLFEHEV